MILGMQRRCPVSGRRYSEPTPFAYSRGYEPLIDHDPLSPGTSRLSTTNLVSHDEPLPGDEPLIGDEPLPGDERLPAPSAYSRGYEPRIDHEPLPGD